MLSILASAVGLEVVLESALAAPLLSSAMWTRRYSRQVLQMSVLVAARTFFVCHQQHWNDDEIAFLQDSVCSLCVLLIRLHLQ